MLFSEATGHRVMSTDTATTVGTVNGFVVDASAARVVAMRLKGSSGGDTLHWEDLTSFGTDTVTVPSAGVITDARGRTAELDTKAAELHGKRVLTDAGTDVGTVADIDFNPANGSLIAILTSGGIIYADRLIGCGSYAVVVKDG